ncbi:hypothetical protein B0H12DRAFT_1229043 [Mycena haematopus]|nr:hypothetical protein B0H12DRAFT_1229043 [Mycena haematopus]
MFWGPRTYTGGGPADEESRPERYGRRPSAEGDVQTAIAELRLQLLSEAPRAARNTELPLSKWTAEPHHLVCRAMDSLAQSSSACLSSGRRGRRDLREEPRGLALSPGLVALHSGISTTRRPFRVSLRRGPTRLPAHASRRAPNPLRPLRVPASILASPQRPHPHHTSTSAKKGCRATHPAISIPIPYGNPTLATPYTLPSRPICQTPTLDPRSRHHLLRHRHPVCLLHNHHRLLCAGCTHLGFYPPGDIPPMPIAVGFISVYGAVLVVDSRSRPVDDVPELIHVASKRQNGVKEIKIPQSQLSSRFSPSPLPAKASHAAAPSPSLAIPLPTVIAPSSSKSELTLLLYCAIILFVRAAVFVPAPSPLTLPLHPSYAPPSSLSHGVNS